MRRKCKICIKEIEIICELLNTKTADLIWNKLPIKKKLKTWGKEIYFSCEINVDLEDNAKSIISLGEIVYWPDGKFIAIGFGPTPISIKNEIRLAADCNIWGKTKDSLSGLDAVNNDELIEIIKI